MTDPCRIPCYVRGCRRTRKPHPIWTEWLCPKHWGMVPQRRRQAYLRARRKGKPPAVLARLWRGCTATAVAQDFSGGWR